MKCHDLGGVAFCWNPETDSNSDPTFWNIEDILYDGVQKNRTSNSSMVNNHIRGL